MFRRERLSSEIEREISQLIVLEEIYITGNLSLVVSGRDYMTKFVDRIFFFIDWCEQRYLVALLTRDFNNGEDYVEFYLRVDDKIVELTRLIKESPDLTIRCLHGKIPVGLSHLTTSELGYEGTIKLIESGSGLKEQVDVGLAKSCLSKLIKGE